MISSFRSITNMPSYSSFLFEKHVVQTLNENRIANINDFDTLNLYYLFAF